MASQPIDKPLHVEAREGFVLINGENGTVISMTAHAALETCEKLTAVALQVIGQQVLKVRRLDEYGK